MPLRAALIGCGRIGSLMADDPLLAGDVFTHAEAYAHSPHTELVAVCDRDPALAERCARRWEIAEAYSDVVAMLRQVQPDVISICTPDNTHFAVAQQALEIAPSVRGILCEKPLATSLAEAELLVEEARRRGVVLAVCYMRRYAANIRALRSFLSSGELGKITAVTGWYTNGVLHNGSHWFDMLRMLAGAVVWVEAHNVLGEGGEDPTLDVLLGLESGALATLRAARAEDFTLFEMDILAERGRIRLIDSGHSIEVYRAAPSARYSGYVELIAEPQDFGHRRDQLLYAVDDLARAVAEGRQPACTGYDGVAALRIGGAALEASPRGIRIRLDEFERGL